MNHVEQRVGGPDKSRTINQAQALEYFEQFINATSLKNILGYFRTMCEILHLKPTYYPLFYPKLKAMLNSWKAKAIWKKLDSRSNHKCYGKAKIGEKTRVLIIGGGPCGLRTAIEAQLLGCKVVVVEKRDRLSRNNVLHLWPFVIEDLRALGAKKFFGKFCAGSIDHISIRQLQCILLKVALILGVEIHTEVSFENLIEPNHDEKIGWRAQLKPQNHPVSQYEFDVIIGADGKRNTLAGFKRKEFRGKLAIAITANFINKRTEAEARVEEISGVAFIFNQKFFKDLYQETGIDLENIVYYKDDTHYFVMTAKKPSLIEKGVILQDLADTERLLGADNVNREALLNYAKEAAEFSTNYQMPQLEFAVNHYGQPDVAMFDFTSMFAAENASKVLERSGYQLLMILVGDSLLEPFWPTGSGCARGFLSSLDAAWAIRSWSLAKASPLEVLAERESIYRLLAQTTPDNLNKDWKSYTLDPSTRYPNFNRSTVSPHQIVSLYDTDDIQNIEKMGRNLENTSNISRKRRRDMVDSEILIDWVKQQVKKHNELEIKDLTSIFRSGKVLCAIIHHYRPDLIDYSSLTNNEPSVNNQLAIDILEKDIGIPPIMTGAEITETSDNLALAAYLTQVYDVFRTEIPHVKHPKLKDIYPACGSNSRSISKCIELFPNQENIYVEKIQPLPEIAKERSSSNSEFSVLCEQKSYKSSSESLLILYPFFPSTKPSECSLETVKRHEFNIKANNKIVSLMYGNKKLIDSQRLAIENVNSEVNSENIVVTHLGVNNLVDSLQEIPMKLNENLLANCSEKYLKLRSKLVKKQYLLKKNSTLNFQQKFEIQEININSSKTSLKNCLSNTSLWIKILEHDEHYDEHPVKMQPSRNTLTLIADTYSSNLTQKKEISDRYVKSKCRFSKNIQINFSSNANMCDAEENESIGPDQVFSRVSYWIESNDFYEDDSQCTDIFDINTEPIETNIEEGFSDITSITKCLERKTMGRTKKLVVRELSEHKNTPRVTGKDDFSTKLKSVNENKMLKPLGKFSTYPAEEKPECPVPFSVITEGQESELPESKYTTTSFKTIIKEPSGLTTSNINSRPSSKHKRHIEGILATKSANIERKTRKRKTFDKAGSVDYDNKPPSLVRGNTDEDFVAKIKSIEQGWQGTQVAEKKPKDLLRKIGKIETSDWNIKEIEKKIKENKMGKPILRDKEKVPKWSREQFVARQTKMEKLDRQDSSEGKYADIDKNIKYLDMKLKEGTNRDLGQNKVATITEKLAKKIPEPTEPVVAKSTDKPVILPSYSGSEFCHFCCKRVYLMERLSAEGRFFHHGCFKCQYCKAQLRLGSYAFDKDGIYGHKFFCLHHYGMQGETRSTTKVSRKPSQKGVKPAAKKILSGVSGVDLLDRVRTPERVEFSNLSRCSSDQEDSLSQMDEDEWTDRNFGASTAEVGSSDDDDSSSYSETDSDDEEAYEEALEEPATKEGTMKWAERMSKRHYSKQYKSDSDAYGSSDSSSYYENSSDDDDSNTATEGEEEIRARELRLQEVRLEPPIIQADTGTDTEVISDDNSSDISSEVQNSATEISTDSEFAQDDPTPTSEIPAIVLNDLYVNMSRGSSSNRPKKIQVTSGFIQKPNGKAPKQDIELNLTPLVSPAPSLRKITPSIKPPTEAYALNRTQSTGGIATKVSLELKKRYLLGESIGSGSIQKSGSASTLDTKLKSFCSNISDCQKLLKPASEISASMQTFCNKLDEHTSPILSPLSINKQLPVESKENNENGKVEVLPPPDLINVTLSEKKEETVEQTFENETEGRPRSPLHETSLIVPEIDWKKIGLSVESTSSSSSSSSSDEQINTPNLSHNKIPTVEIHNADDPPDDIKKLWDNHSIASDSVKSIASDKKQLNQPKTLPGLINDIPVGTMKKMSKESGYKKISPQDDKSSECSTPISGGEEITAAFTETELSDWARDGGVSDDLEGMAFDLNIENDMQQKVPELSILNHVCGKTDQEKQVNNEQQSANFDSIEFMDTCTESNSEEGIVDSIGYNLFKNEDITEDSLNLSINENIEEKNTCMDDSKIKNSGYCVLATESSNFGGEVINLKPSDIEQLKHNQNLTEREEDSLVVIETTTEENTCSDSTVKNITEIPVDANKLYETNIQKQRLEEKLVQLKKEKKETMLKAQIDKECDKEKDGLDDYKIAEMKNVQFEEHCQRLQSKVDFGNVKDSIDIRKSRRKSRDSPQKPDFIQEEKQYFGSSNSLKEITLNLTPTIKTPEQIYKKEVIEKERDVNQKLVQEMVMSKMRAENKALERRVRTRPTHNLNRGFQLSKSATSDMANVNNVSNLENQGVSNILKQTSCNFVLKEKEPIIELNALQKSRTSPNIPEDNIRKVVCDLHVPVVPPRSRDLKNSTDKLRNDARVRAKMLSNDELGLSPEDKLQKFREKSKMYDRSISKENSEFQLFPMSLNTQVIPRRKILQRPLSEYSPKISENRKSFSTICDDNKQLKMCHSESNLLDMKNGKAKGKEVSPKKGIKFIKIMDLFSKKSPKGLFSKISAKSKDTSKEKPLINKHARVKSFPEASSQINSAEVPPPVPPLPLCYTEQLLRNSEESSEDELKRSKQTPCETGDASGIFDDSLSSLTERHPHKRNRRSIREAQLKRHRMAQEIQRKLEETEVKTKELEERGVVIEKNLRGELSQGSSKQESDLLQEWFDIMRDRTELRRYEKELIIRAQELELEDRHARLQHQLRKRLSEENKTEEDKDADCRIINEMLEIVSKRDSLTALLEEDRLRYLSEDRDFEEQMLAKDLYLTPNGKSMKNN